MSTYETPRQETDDRIDPVDRLEFTTKTGKRAVYEAFEFERTGDIVRVWNESHGADAAAEHVYTVELDARDVPARCTCPAFEYHCGPGEMCKHGVAVALHLPQIDDVATVATDGGIPEYLTRMSTITGGEVFHCQTCGGEGATPGGVAHHEECPEISTTETETATDGGQLLEGDETGGSDDRTGERVRVPVAGGVLVYEQRGLGKELVGFEDVQNWDDVADALRARGHGTGAVYHLPVLDDDQDDDRDDDGVEEGA